MTEETARVLMNSGQECVCRGPIHVKVKIESKFKLSIFLGGNSVFVIFFYCQGKGIITTYFVKTPFDGKKKKIPRCDAYQLH